jgi:hypothetical protein
MEKNLPGQFTNGDAGENHRELDQERGCVKRQHGVRLIKTSARGQRGLRTCLCTGEVRVRFVVTVMDPNFQSRWGRLVEKGVDDAIKCPRRVR